MNWMPNFRAISIFLLLILAFTQVAAKVSLKPLPAEQFSSITSAKKHPLSSHYNNLPANFQKLISMKGGESNNSNEVTKPSFLSNWKKNLLGIWGVVQVVSILGNALKRLIPIALQPIQQNNLTPIHWAMLLSVASWPIRKVTKPSIWSSLLWLSLVPLILSTILPFLIIF